MVWLTKLVKLTSDKHRNYSLNGMAYSRQTSKVNFRQT